MSHIFDALQRSEAESSGAELPGLLEATELLKRAERRANSQWEAGASPQLHESSAVSALEKRMALREAPSTAESSSAAETVQQNDRTEAFSRFQSLEVSLTQGNGLVCYTEP